MTPFVSIIIPFRKQNPYLFQCLEHMAHLHYKNFEVILLPDEAEPYPIFPFPLKVFSTGPIGPAQKRDIGNQKAKGEILAFIDDDAYPAPDWLTHAIPHFSNESVAAVTGPAATPDSDTFLQKASGLIYSNRFSSGHCAHRYRPEKLKEVDDAASVNLIVRKKAYEAVDGFNTHYYPGEDTKLCLDFIQKLKKKIIYDPQALVWHHRRSLLIPHLKQVSQYALHRGFFMKRFPQTSLKLKYFLPTLFSLYLFFLPLLFITLPELKVILGAPLLAYSILFSFSLIKENSPSLALVSFIGGILTHITYGVYLLKGLLMPELKR